MPECDFCYEDAEGEVEFEDGEIKPVCAECAFEFIKYSLKPVVRVTEYDKKEAE